MGALEPFPWVVIPIREATISNPLEKLFMAVARFNKSLGSNGSMPKALDMWTTSPLVMDNNLLVYLQPLDLNANSSPRKISALRKSAKALVGFAFYIIINTLDWRVDLHHEVS